MLSKTFFCLLVTLFIVQQALASRYCHTTSVISELVYNDRVTMNAPSFGTDGRSVIVRTNGRIPACITLFGTNSTSTPQITGIAIEEDGTVIISLISGFQQPIDTSVQVYVN